MDESAESGVVIEALKVLVAASVEAVLRTQGECRFKMGKGLVGISAQSVRNRQSVMDVILAWFQLVGLAEMLNGVLEIPGIQAGDTQGVVLVG
jgi:hypothetical protein